MHVCCCKTAGKQNKNQTNQKQERVTFQHNKSYPRKHPSKMTVKKIYFQEKNWDNSSLANVH